MMPSVIQSTKQPTKSGLGLAVRGVRARHIAAPAPTNTNGDAEEWKTNVGNPRNGQLLHGENFSHRNQKIQNFVT